MQLGGSLPGPRLETARNALRLRHNRYTKRIHDHYAPSHKCSNINNSYAAHMITGFREPGTPHLLDINCEA
jgi:hypothetical protein